MGQISEEREKKGKALNGFVSEHLKCPLLQYDRFRKYAKIRNASIVRKDLAVSDIIKSRQIYQ